MKRAAIALVLACVNAVVSGAAFAQSSGTRSSAFGYDATSGLLTQEVIEPGTPALRLQTDYVYDAYGNKTSATVSGIDIVTRAASTTYDTQGRFATSATNALGQSESRQYDPRFGLPTSHTGPNGVTTTWSYDDFGRRILEVRADGTQSKFTYAFCSGVNGGTASCPTGAVWLNQANSFAADGTTQNAPTVTTYFDSLGREVVRDTQGFDGSIVRGAKQYNSQGRVLKVSRPYFVNGGTPQWTTYTYDTLGRATLVTMPDNSTVQNAYHGLTTTETNALSQTRTVTKNSQGDMVSVTDALGQTMLYAYNAFGKLIQTTDAQTNVVIATYDTRGRKIASNDPNLGTWTYSYNVFGELVSQTDAKGQTSTFSYDKLSRLLQRVEPDMTSVWIYDIAANGIGKLASASITAGLTAGYQRTMTYDTLGRPSQVATKIDGTTYTMGAGYDANGRLSQVTYPSGFVAGYGYNSLGYSNQLSDGSAQTFWTANGLDAEQHVTQQTSGNGIVTTRTFSATTGRLQSIGAGASNTVQNSSYAYDLLGNPLSRTDDTQNLSESFTYDPLNRLLTATVSGSVAPPKAYAYNSVGNMMSKSDVGTYSYAPPGSPLPHAVTSISGSTISATFTYDPNGNQTSGLGRTVTWTAYNMPATITQGTRTVSVQYDTEHQRIKQVTPDGTAIYINAFGVVAELFGVGAASPRWNEYLSVGKVQVGMRVKEIATTTISLRYFHTDDLGSISVITNESGVVVERLSYDAWGKRRHPNGADDPTGNITSQSTRGYTGHEMMSDVALINMNARAYDPLLARFTSADTIVPNAADSQSWNRYAYVTNSPLKYTDPTGHEPGTAPVQYLDPIVAYASYDYGGFGFSWWGSSFGSTWMGSYGHTGSYYALSPAFSGGISQTLTAAFSVPRHHLFWVGGTTGGDVWSGKAYEPARDALPGGAGAAVNSAAYESMDSQTLPPVEVVAPEPRSRSIASTGSPTRSMCTFFCSMLGGPKQTSFGTYNHQMFGFGMSATGYAVSAMQIGVPGPEDVLIAGAIGFAAVRVAKGGLIPWTNRSVRDAVKSLDRGATEVRVGSRAQAEEILLGKYQGSGYRNSTGMSPSEAKNYFNGKMGTYHWDEGVHNLPHGADHLQIHDFSGAIIRIYFP